MFCIKRFVQGRRGMGKCLNSCTSRLKVGIGLSHKYNYNTRTHCLLQAEMGGRMCRDKSRFDNNSSRDHKATHNGYMTPC